MRRIADYALLGDCHSAALVGRDGSIDWACFPRFDAPAVFCRILDARRGGSFGVSPEGPFTATRAYVEDTNVLATTFTTSRGVLEVVDCMPVSPGASGGTSVSTRHALLRRVRCLDGEVRVRAVVAPRFEYGAFVPRVRLTSWRTAEVVGGADALWIAATHPLMAHESALRARWTLRAGDEAWIEAAWTPSFVERVPTDAPGPADFRRRLEDTLTFWRTWIGRCEYTGEHARAVRRSALTLKALTYAPTGALVAAPTTSLPEELGGSRNWDYRFTWLRDASLTLISLLVLGYREEADAFRYWLRRTSAGRAEDVQIMYGIQGHRLMPEVELSHLSGHAGSRPVRIGNGAVKQLQLDVPGELLEATWLYARAGGPVTPSNWAFLSGLVEEVCRRWRLPDQGLWEMRDAPRHFIHSKLLCWVALDRGLRLARERGLPVPLVRWAREREALRRYLMECAADGWFPQSRGSDVADASTLLVPALGFLPLAHPLVRGTVRRVRERLESGGLLYRYLAPDGLSGGEGAFLLCSFWLVDVLAHEGRREDAEVLLSRLLGLANDVGLYAEEAVPLTGEALGNFPQAFTHMALVSSCAQLSAVHALEQRRPPEQPRDFAAVALEHLLESRGRLGREAAAALPWPLEPDAVATH
ncbi:glycoside hydrolase family 15 protein [Myxococcus llanfairpwllgwyngyllgogerychwyrndrobwllllantysiliogogogochensis]|uniref:Glycoside hydrolase family 15 protein n=1 Tax=Myxococcus llanfairpwllgwyngyllgogerychwyrndrobwllllantysiliogogogochensis TaxID=2590453 RepID=A0A540X9C6_9BACT|nr:glycoside hydrolase family 15 protein [Myxococcus llanfairpwllgwyngyllgogerychwyrndrobwllllantysiliogogogochensis]TQF17893.1 glycoside hydrolase family 15 protein [Myxococcus llanfairpwllgwyngyllgogerychwyrndrobwllllantysiliogogogochensis]